LLVRRSASSRRYWSSPCRFNDGTSGRQEQLLKQLGFQKLVASLSTQFCEAAPGETDEGIERALGGDF